MFFRVSQNKRDVPEALGFARRAPPRILSFESFLPLFRSLSVNEFPNSPHVKTGQSFWYALEQALPPLCLSLKGEPSDIP